MKYSSLKNQSLFWDTDLKNLDMIRNRDFIISRIIESGDLSDVYWLKDNYSDQEITETVKTSKLISRKTATFWKIVLDIKEEILCLSDQYRKTQKTLWI